MPARKKDIEKLNETGQRKRQDRRKKNVTKDASGNAVKERRKVKRRRQIDPTTCEREYSEQEIEFMRAMDDYKRASGRMFPTCSEILEVLSNLGYRQVAETQAVYNPDADRAVANEEDIDMIEEAEEQLA